MAYILLTKKGRSVGFVKNTEASEKIKEGQADKIKSDQWEVEDED